MAGIKVGRVADAGFSLFQGRPDRLDIVAERVDQSHSGNYDTSPHG